MKYYYNYTVPTRTELQKKYGLSEKEFENLRRRTGERIQRSKELYVWNADDVPEINRLIEYELRGQRGQRRADVGKFEAILETSATKKLSNKARLNALKIYSGEKGTFNSGFYEFSKGIKQFTIMKENARQRLEAKKGEENIPLEKLPLFEIGVPLSDETGKNYYITVSDVGRNALRELNNLVQQYNREIDSTTRENALQNYITFVRLLMQQWQDAQRKGAIAGS